MNCKPNQLAWIVVPPHQARNGLEVLNRQVVCTKRLLPINDMPVWEVEPHLTVTWTRPGRDLTGRLVEPGDVLHVDGVPDYWLRPFDPDSAPKHELELAVDGAEQPS
jgi:hypothetical protein